MDNCGISCGNDLKIIAKGDTIIIHYTFSIIHWQVQPATQTGIGNTQKDLSFQERQVFSC